MRLIKRIPVSKLSNLPITQKFKFKPYLIPHLPTRLLRRTTHPPHSPTLFLRHQCTTGNQLTQGILLDLSNTVGLLAGVLGQQPLVIYCNMFCSHLKGTSLLINENLAAKARIIRDSLGKAGARVVVESTSVFTNKGKVAAHLKSYQKELAAAKKAASLAARLCQNVQKSLLQSDVQSKLDKSPVTVADYGSQAVVSFVLERELSFEPFSLVAEEDSGDLRKDDARDTLERIRLLVNETIGSENTYSISPLSAEDMLVLIDNGRSEGGAVGRHWVLDPIDGTKGFLRGDQYAIALALLDQGKVVLGVLACPNLPLAPIGVQSSGSQTGCLYSAVIGNGTFMESLDGSSSPIKVTVSPTENSEEASFFESFEAAHSLHDLTSSIAKKLGVKAPPVRIDSQAKYGALSRGDGAIYLRFPHAGYREKIWDHAAGAIVVTEAGGVVSDAAGKPLDFSQGKYLDLYKGIVASNKKLMPAVLKAIQESIDEKPASL